MDGPLHNAATRKVHAGRLHFLVRLKYVLPTHRSRVITPRLTELTLYIQNFFLRNTAQAFNSPATTLSIRE